MKPIWILNDLFVVEEARRLGIGEQLLTAATDYALQTGAVRLELSTVLGVPPSLSPNSHLQKQP
jgi:GNAT superfamily N-acetyltransferase